MRNVIVFLFVLMIFNEVAVFVKNVSAAPDQKKNVNQSLLSAATRGNLEEARLFVKKGAEINYRGIFNTTPLLAASSTVEDQPKLVDYLIQKGAEINCKNDLHETPLHLAVKYQRVETVKVLMRYHADTTLKDKSGKTAIDLAIVDGNAEIISLVKSSVQQNKPIQTNRSVPEQTLKKLKGICYIPHDTGLHQTKLQLDIIRLSQISENIRTFSTASSFAILSALNNSIETNILIGCRINNNKSENKKEIEGMIEIAKSLGDKPLIGVVIGEEVLSQKKASVDDLLAYVKSLKKETGCLVSTSEISDYWIKYPQLVTNTDFIGLVLQPFLEGIDVDSAVDYMWQKFNRLKKVYPNKRIIISKIGWPSCGNVKKKAIPSPLNQASFFERFFKMAEEYNLEYFYYKGFDVYDRISQPTKLVSNWGVHDKNGRLKQLILKTLTPTHSPGFTNTCGMAFVYLYPDSFMMGADGQKKGHKVTFSKGFYIQTTEVTQKQWIQVMQKQPAQMVIENKNHPVINISWNDCIQFINTLNQMENTDRYRLPTEAEWEFACRSGTSDVLPWKNKNKICQYANIFDLTPKNQLFGSHPFLCKDGYLYSAPVASFKPNAFGLYDMIGNVWEWCQDYIGPYPSVETTDPKGVSDGMLRVIRGGGWNSSEEKANPYYRGKGRPDKTGRGLGFRLVYKVN